MRRRLTAAAACLALLLPVACSGDDGATTVELDEASGGSSTTTSTTTTQPEDDRPPTSEPGGRSEVDLCVELAEQGSGRDVPDELLSLPADERDPGVVLFTILSLMSVIEAIELDPDSELPSPDDAEELTQVLEPHEVSLAVEALGQPDVADQITSLFNRLGESCEDPEITAAGGTFSALVAEVLAPLVTAGTSPAYCASLQVWVDSLESLDETDLEALPDLPDDELEALLPPEHLAVFRTLETLDLGSLSGDEADAALLQLAGLFWGLGLYAEARCDIEGGTAAGAVTGGLMFMFGAFASAFSEFEDVPAEGGDLDG